MALDDRPHFNVALYALAQVIAVVAATPALLPKFVKVLAVFVVGWVTCHIIFTQTTGDKGGDNGIGSALLAHYLAVIDYVLLSRPEDLRSINDKDATKIAQRPLRNRLIWAMKLYTNPRGIGCVHEVPDIQNRVSPSTPRLKFVVSRITYAIISLVMLCLACLVNEFNAALHTPGKGLTEAPFHLRVIGVACFGIAGSGALSAIHSTAAAVTVGCGIYSPHQWPYLFGSPLQAWSIKRFWRRVWHQNLRRLELSTTSFFMQYIPFSNTENGIVAYKLTRCCIVFFIAGIVHMGGDKMLTGQLTFNWSFMFFMLQPLGIAIESLVCYLWGHRTSNQPSTLKHDQGNGIKRMRSDTPDRIQKRDESDPPLWIRCVGYIWVASWFTWTVAYIVDPLCYVDMFSYPQISRLVKW